MTSDLTLLLFGDQTGNINDSLRELHLLSRGSVLLSKYLCVAFETLKHGTHGFPDSETYQFLREDFLGLGDVQSTPNAINPTKCTVLYCVAQLGWALA